MEAAFAERVGDPHSAGIRTTLSTVRDADGKALLKETVEKVGDLQAAGITQVAINGQDFAKNVDQLGEVVDAVLSTPEVSDRWALTMDEVGS